MQTSTIVGFPFRKLDAARHAIAVAYKRLGRSASRTGQTAPEAPIVRPTQEYTLSRCTYCHCQERGFAGGACIACGKGHTISRLVCDVEISYTRPALAGWDFLAVVEPLGTANLIKQVPGADVAEGELVQWREGAIKCDHCNTVRNRHETFIVRADGTDTRIARGTYRQVGKDCLAAFTGGKSAAAILLSFDVEKLVCDAGSDGDGGAWPSTPEIFDPIDFLAWTAAVTRISGYTSKARANVAGTQSTAGWVDHLLTPPGPAGMAMWKANREKYAPTSADLHRAGDALAWARALASLPNQTDYERNLALVAAQPFLQPKHGGILASAIPSHARSIGESLEANRSSTPTQPSAHLSAIGDKQVAFGPVTLERVVTFPTDYGTLHVHTFRDKVGNLIVWKTSKGNGSAGDTFELRGTIKAHSEFRGEKQTEVTRCKLVASGEVKAEDPEALNRAIGARLGYA